MDSVSAIVVAMKIVDIEFNQLATSMNGPLGETLHDYVKSVNGHNY
jgi:hypothetical protein